MAGQFECASKVMFVIRGCVGHLLEASVKSDVNTGLDRWDENLEGL